MDHPDPDLGNTLDCRGLSAPLTVLRIKQAVLNVPETHLPLQVMVGSNCPYEAVAAGLRAGVCDVRLFCPIETCPAAIRPNAPLPAGLRRHA